MLSRLSLRSTGLDIQRSSSVLVTWVTWRKSVRTGLDAIKAEPEKYRLGHTKVFFRAGYLGYMEEVREDRIGSVLSWLQSQARGKASRLVFKKMQDQKLALYCLQRTIRNYYIGKTWGR